MKASPSAVSCVGSHSSNSTSLQRMPISGLNKNTWIFSMHRENSFSFYVCVGLWNTACESQGSEMRPSHLARARRDCNCKVCSPWCLKHKLSTWHGQLKWELCYYAQETVEGVLESKGKLSFIVSLHPQIRKRIRVTQVGKAPRGSLVQPPTQIKANSGIKQQTRRFRAFSSQVLKTNLQGQSLERLWATCSITSLSWFGWFFFLISKLYNTLLLSR